VPLLELSVVEEEVEFIGVCVCGGMTIGS